jgi:hypothetical protein
MGYMENEITRLFRTAEERTPKLDDVFIINENSFGFDEVLFPDNYWIDSVD